MSECLCVCVKLLPYGICIHNIIPVPTWKFDDPCMCGVDIS